MMSRRAGEIAGCMALSLAAVACQGSPRVSASPPPDPTPELAGPDTDAPHAEAQLVAGELRHEGPLVAGLLAREGSSFPGALVTRLEGPHAAPELALAAWFAPPGGDDPDPDRDPDPDPDDDFYASGCEGEAPDRSPRQTRRVDLSDPALPDGLLEARFFRFESHMACAPIEYCALALRTRRGWWLTPRNESFWCQGVIGPGASVATEELDLWPSEEAPPRLVVSGVRVETRLEIVAPMSAGGRERNVQEVVTRDPWAVMCEVSADGSVWCQTPVDAGGPMAW